MPSTYITARPLPQDLTGEGKTSALQRNDADIEDTVWRNIDGLWAKLRYRSVVNREVAKCCGGKKFGHIKYTGSIVVIGDPEDSRLIAPQLHLMWLESLPGDVNLEQIGRRPIGRRDKRWIVHLRRRASPSEQEKRKLSGQNMAGKDANTVEEPRRDRQRLHGRFLCFVVAANC